MTWVILAAWGVAWVALHLISPVLYYGALGAFVSVSAWHAWRKPRD